MDKCVYGGDRSRDNAAYYRIPMIGSFFQWRLSSAIKLLGNGQFNDILDIGYGGGFLFDRLTGHASRLYGVDTHQHGGKIQHVLQGEGLRLSLTRGEIRKLPFAHDSFDAVFSMSLLEHIVEIDRAVAELYRVLRVGGRAIVGFPPRTWLTSLLFDLIGFDHKRLHPTHQETIIGALRNRFEIDVVKHLPSIGSLYILCRCIKTDSLNSSVGWIPGNRGDGQTIS